MSAKGEVELLLRSAEERLAKAQTFYDRAVARRDPYVQMSDYLYGRIASSRDALQSAILALDRANNDEDGEEGGKSVAQIEAKIEQCLRRIELITPAYALTEEQVKREEQRVQLYERNLQEASYDPYDIVPLSLCLRCMYLNHEYWKNVFSKGKDLPPSWPIAVPFALARTFIIQGLTEMVDYVVIAAIIGFWLSTSLAVLIYLYWNLGPTLSSVGGDLLSLGNWLGLT